MTLLDKIPLLDHGYVRLQNASPSHSNLEEIRKRAYKGTMVAHHFDLPYVHVEICCPYAILLTLVSSGLTALPYQDMNRELAFLPDAGNIRSGTLADDMAISDHIKTTVESTMLNQQAYAKDNCDRAIATLTTPLAAYWEGVIHGKLSSFLRFTESKHQPRIIQVYQEGVRNSISLEYKNLSEMILRL